MATEFETAIDSAGDAVIGYAGTALPIVGTVAVAFLGVKYLKRLIGRL
jgi:uncharacterized membrane protein